MTEHPPRVAVSHPRTSAAERHDDSTLAAEFQSPSDVSGVDTATVSSDGSLSELAVRAIVRAQLLLALRYFASLLFAVVSLALAVVVVPRVKSLTPGGVPIAWIVFAVAYFPIFWILGVGYRRAADRLEDRFVHVIEPR